MCTKLAVSARLSPSLETDESRAQKGGIYKSNVNLFRMGNVLLLSKLANVRDSD